MWEHSGASIPDATLLPLFRIVVPTILGTVHRRRAPQDYRSSSQLSKLPFGFLDGADRASPANFRVASPNFFFVKASSPSSSSLQSSKIFRQRVGNFLWYQRSPGKSPRNLPKSLPRHSPFVPRKKQSKTVAIFSNKLENFLELLSKKLSLADPCLSAVSRSDFLRIAPRTKFFF